MIFFELGNNWTMFKLVLALIAGEKSLGIFIYFKEFL